MRDFAAEVERERAELARDRYSAVGRLRVLEEEWARALLGLPQDGLLTSHVRRWFDRGRDPVRAELALEHLRAAESWQSEFGTWSTGSGEGLESEAEVCTLLTAQAWLLAAMGDVTGARALIEEVEADPNGMGGREAASLRALRSRL